MKDEKKEISSILSRASRDDIEEIAAPLKEESRIQIVKDPQKTLVMVKVRESVGRSLFYLGEVLAAECMVLVDGTKGFYVTAGDDFERVLNGAVIDGYLNHNRGNEKERSVIEQIRRLDEKQKAERGWRNAQILKSKVNFNVMGNRNMTKQEEKACGFDFVHDGQRVFRSLMKAMSNPGTIQDIGEQAEKFGEGYAPLTAVGCTLLDNEEIAYVEKTPYFPRNCMI